MSRRIWIHALGAKIGGGLTYLGAVVPRLAARLEGTDTTLTVLAPGTYHVGLPPWVEVRTVPWAASGSLRRLVFDQLVLPVWLAREKVDALYCSGSFAPLIQPSPTVVLLRNAIYFDRAFVAREVPARRLLLRLQERLVVAAAARATALVYPSESMRRLVEARHPHLGGQGRHSLYGIEEAFLSPVRGNGASPRRRDGRWTFLYVMHYTLQKNVGYVLRALAAAKAEGLPVRVIVTSDLADPPRAVGARDRALVDEHDLVASGHLVLAGARYGAGLFELYESADACLFPSSCESFGHPLVEALALGKPLIAADLPYAREICGEHALFVDPERPDALVELWRRWPSASHQVEAVPTTTLRERFSWDRHVDTLAALLA
ncbi:MAG TPA: glycosyltransferase [Thermoanaerobaculia bacterium]|nr:glycosyltransferase [Thermoanaerobaculia bacterium]